jgi:hypothetical protein
MYYEMFITQRRAVAKDLMAGFLEKEKDLQFGPIFRQGIRGSSRRAPAPKMRNSFDNDNEVPSGFGHQHKVLEGTGKHSPRILLDRVRGICCRPRNSGESILQEAIKSVGLRSKEGLGAKRGAPGAWLVRGFISWLIIYIIHIIRLNIFHTENRRLSISANTRSYEE